MNLAKVESKVFDLSLSQVHSSHSVCTVLCTTALDFDGGF